MFPEILRNSRQIHGKPNHSIFWVHLDIILSFSIIEPFFSIPTFHPILLISGTRSECFHDCMHSKICERKCTLIRKSTLFFSITLNVLLFKKNVQSKETLGFSWLSLRLFTVTEVLTLLSDGTHTEPVMGGY